MSEGRVVVVTHEEGIRAAELICMVIRGEVVRTELSLVAVNRAVKTIDDYNKWRRAFPKEPAA